MKTVQLLTSKRVAEMLSIPEGTLRYWRNVGIGPVWHKLEGSIRYDVDDVSRYVEKNRRIPSVRAFMEEHDGSQSARRNLALRFRNGRATISRLDQRESPLEGPLDRTHLMSEARQRKLNVHRRTLTLTDFSSASWIGSNRHDWNPNPERITNQVGECSPKPPSPQCAWRTSRPTRPRHSGSNTPPRMRTGRSGP